MVSFFFPSALVAFLLISGFHAFRFNDEENKALQETCGSNMKEVGHYSRKVLNGEAAHSGESPWSVAVYIPDHLNHTVYTTGTLISSRHVISYDRLFFTNTTGGIVYRHDMEQLEKDLCGAAGSDLVLPRKYARQVSVYADTLKADRFSGKQELGVKSVRILNGCVTPHHLNRVAVIELQKQITDDLRAQPICVGYEERPSAPFTFYGFGDNRGEVIDATLRHTEVTEVPCEFPSDELFCVKAQEPLCNGDFGGAAVKTISGSVRAFGVYVDGPYECSKADENTVYTFANMTRLAEKICEDSGVCAGYVPKSTTPAPEATTTQKYIPTVPFTRPPINVDVEHTFGPDGSGGTDYGVTSAPGGITTNPNYTTTGGNNNNTGEGTGQNGDVTLCEVEDEDDIHIHIKLGKFRKSGNENDIEVVRKGPNKQGKRAI
ncbi:hypothetical protein GCK72_019464 [Caenorhabditis remanei]|uniref:Peptidase S1 domain-containing protein n=1 Tax=Caenorhabditis remanei TaxID=31234 RepID=A0A6A5GEP0_CAERE|nr:hypothetical protein GCK72_019464 [Caenorhabditis remanei]KAF1752909.1 hypothetical protein GCK72_019464 [Caenorhabditis remanei]